MASLTEESHQSGKIEKEQPILVILGNPPYSGHSANRGKWIDDLLKKERCPDGSKDKDEKLLITYNKYLEITDIFPLHGIGMTTARNQFVIDSDRKALLNRIRLFKHSKYPDKGLHRFFRLANRKGGI